MTIAANIFYTYAHRRGDTGEVFYVGKGKGKRAWSERSRNAHWRNIVAKCGFTVQLISTELNEFDALSHECELVDIFKLANFPLCNQTAGGDGLRNPSDATRDKMAAAAKGNRRTAGYKHTPEALAKMREAAKNRPSNRKGVKLSDETRKKISAVVTKQMQDPARRKINSDANKGNKIWLGRKHSAESIEKMRTSTLAWNVARKGRQHADCD